MAPTHETAPQMLRSWLKWVFAYIWDAVAKKLKYFYLLFYLWMYAPPKWSVSASRFLQLAQPGDIILISSKSIWTFLQGHFASEPWSHVAVVCRDPATWRLCLAESLSHGETDNIYLHEKRAGPTVVDLAERLQTFEELDGIWFVWRRLIRPRGNGVEAQLSCNDAIVKYMKGCMDKEYNFDVSKMVTSELEDTELYPCCWWPKRWRKPGSKFCSQMAFDVLVYAGICYKPTGTKGSSFSPMKFSQYYEAIPFVDGYGFGPEIKVNIFDRRH